MNINEEHFWIEFLEYPQIASRKLDGIQGQLRAGAKPESKSELPLPNNNLPKLIAELSAVAQSAGLEVFGEFYSESASFDEIRSAIMSRNAPLPADLKFYIFGVKPTNGDVLDFSRQIAEMQATFTGVANVEIIEQHVVNNPDELMAMYVDVVEQGGEGLVVRCEADNSVEKMKHMPTHDAVIIGYNTGKNGTLASLNARMENGEELKINCAGMTNKQKQDVLENQADYIGRWIEFTGMTVGMKRVPRSGTFARFRASLAGVKV